MSKRKNRPSCKCAVCERAIDDSKDESVLCEGTCNGWLHRVCAGLTKAAFEECQKSTDSFLCHYFSQVEVKALKQQLNELRAELAALRKQQQSQPSISEAPVPAPASTTQQQICLYSDTAVGSTATANSQLPYATPRSSIFSD